jgi:hypothetical protein
VARADRDREWISCSAVNTNLWTGLHKSIR